MDQSIIFGYANNFNRTLRKPGYVVIEIFPQENLNTRPHINVIAVFSHRRDANNFVSSKSFSQNFFVYETEIDPERIINRIETSPIDNT